MIVRVGMLVLFAQPVSAAPIQFSSTTYVRAVIAASPEAKKARDGLVSASAKLKSQLAADFFPALTFSGTMKPTGLARNNRFEFPAWRGKANDLSLTPGLSWNLFNSFKDSLSLRDTRLSRDIAREDLEISLQARAIEGVRSYYNLFLRDTLLEVARENLKAQNEQYRLTQDRYLHGMKSKSDLLKTETDLRSSELDVATADAELQLARFKFNILIDRPGDRPVRLEADLEAGTTSPLKLEEAMRRALRKRPELKKERFSRRKSDTAYQLAIKNVLPTLGLDFDMTHPIAAGYRQKTDAFGIGTAVYGLTLRLSLPSTFNFFSQAQNLISARAVQRQSVQNTIALERRIREEVYRAQINLLRAVRSHQIAVRKEDISQQNYEIVSEQYSQGSADVIRLSSALVDYVRARRERMRAYSDSNINRAEFLRAIGESIWR